MCYADALGTPDVLEGVRRFERALGPRYWTPAPLLRELAASGDTFQSWQLRRAPPEGSS
jgi:3-hydroxyacyl-CoA dehydrogenase